jgi:hypothetical protein
LGQPSVEGVMGKVVAVPTPMLTEDGVLSGVSEAVLTDAVLADLPDERDWADVFQRVRAVLGGPLLRESRVTAALLCPAGIGAAKRVRGQWCLPVQDAAGRVLNIRLAGVSDLARDGLGRLPRGCGLVVEAREAFGLLALDLVSVVHRFGMPAIWSVTLDRLPDWVLPWPASDQVKPSAMRQKPPLQVMANEVLRAAIDAHCRADIADQLLAAARDAGFDAVGGLLASPVTAAKALGLAWVAAELRWQAGV